MSLDDAAIERLVDKARAADAWAFGQLFDHFHLPTFRYIISRVHSPADAEDLTQLVFVKALEALRQSTPEHTSHGEPPSLDHTAAATRVLVRCPETGCKRVRFRA